MSEEKELLPCPFCGGGDAAQNGIFIQTNGVYVWCKLCQAGVKKTHWNTRAPSPALTEALRLLEEAFEVMWCRDSWSKDYKKLKESKDE